MQNATQLIPGHELLFLEDHGIGLLGLGHGIIGFRAIGFRVIGFRAIGFRMGLSKGLGL